MSKKGSMRSTNDEKREFIQEKFARVKTLLRSTKVMSENKMAEQLGVKRNLVSCLICKVNISKALKENKKELRMIKDLPITFFKGLAPLKHKEPKEIQDFFFYYGSMISKLDVNAKNIKVVKELCNDYLYKRVKSYGEFIKMQEKEVGGNKLFSQADREYITELEKEVRELKEEVELLKDMLALRDSDPDFFKQLSQQKLDIKKK